MFTLADFVTEFEEKYKGKAVETDGAPAGDVIQCADIPKQFLMDLGIKVYPYGGTEPYAGGVYSGGKTILDGQKSLLDPNGGSWKNGTFKVDFVYDVEKLQRGDIVVFEPGNIWGHTGIFTNIDKVKGYIEVFDQNWGGKKYAWWSNVPKNTFKFAVRLILTERGIEPEEDLNTKYEKLRADYEKLVMDLKTKDEEILMLRKRITELEDIVSSTSTGDFVLRDTFNLVKENNNILKSIKETIEDYSEEV